MGEHFDTHYLEEFSHFRIALFSHSPHTRMEWKIFTGRAMSTDSDTTWWSRWEVYHQLMVQFGDVLSFLESHDEMTSKSHLKLLEFLTDSKKKVFLQTELAAFVDIGELFVKAKYNLEGDSPLVLQAYDQIQIVKAKIENPHYPNVDALAISLAAQGRTYQQLKQHASKCVQPGIDYFNSKFFNDSAPLSESLAAFKAARLFVPHRLIEMEAGVLIL